MKIRFILVISIQALLLNPVCATESDSLRLFYGLSGENRKDEKSDQPKVIKADSSVQTNAEKSSPALQRPPSNRRSYHYNGFISSLIGYHYFINGELLAELDSIELISTENAGRTLRLKTDYGYEFKISIGETILPAPVQEKIRLKDTPVSDAS